MALQDIPLPFGEWLPDLGENENPGLVEAKNVIARPGGYAPVKDVFPFLVAAPAAAASVIGNAFVYQRGTGYGVDYGKPGTLYSSLGVSPVTSVSVSSTSSATEPWQFAQFNETIYAVNVGNSSASTSSNLYSHTTSSSTYANVVVSGLRGRSIARVNNFLMIAGANDIIGSSVLDDLTFRWSGFNQPDSWAVSQTTMAGGAKVRDASLGKLTGVAPIRSSGLLFQEYGVSRVDFVGPPQVWRETIISTGVGCIAPRSIVSYNELTFFISHDGIHVTDGVSVSSISESRVNDWLRMVLRINGSQAITAAVDWPTKTVIWAFQGVGENYTLVNTNFANMHLLYNVETNRFSISTFVSRGLAKSRAPVVSGSVAGTTPGYFWAVADGQVDEIAGEPVFGLTVGPLLGDALAAEITTGYTALAPGKRVDVANVEPVYDGSGAKVAINTKQTQAGAAVAGTPVAVNSLGIADVRASGRLAAVSVTFDAGAEWSELKGAVVTGDVSGAR